ncbi:MAG: hypothetical protein GX203_05420 [Acholeplasmataceae bacterium]|nr:hypothetical protein [Acholeplasmataceae bacterium]HOA63693.1 hypothetical protein [Bacilli bacterium]HPT89497.1 hypothetical protein [Bacilli bacterium]HQA19460.1 hypothetical protein [Bacilli bacterium]HQD92129.1 hypothetical protein [Bacilli bacterium]
MIFPDLTIPIVWKQGEIYELVEAYESGILTHEHLEKLYNNVKNLHHYLYNNRNRK